LTFQEVSISTKCVHFLVSLPRF